MPLPLRVRVALAFLLTTAVALVALGVFVQVRVADTLEERLEDDLESEMQRLVAAPAERREAAARVLTGETYGQVLSEDGTVLGSSPRLPGRLLPPGPPADEGYVDRVVTVRDDETDDGDRPVETEPALLLVTRAGDQVIVVGTARDDTDQAVAEVRAQLLVSGPIVLLLAGLLGYAVAGVGLRPIEQLRARAAEISDRNAEERLPVPAASDELRRLAETLNAMLDRLDDGLRRQRRFVAEASHELRTPLALIRTEIELALSRSRTQEELTAALRSVDEETRRLAALTEDLLLLASADEAGLALDPGPVDLTALAGDVVRRFEAVAEAGGRVVTLAASGPVQVVGDRGRLDQVLANLVDNALRHGDGQVEIAVGSDAGGAAVAVSDEGAGFAEERPFDRFVASHGTTGLGLSIANEIVRAHGGTITVARESRRTVLRILLPTPG